MNRRYFIETYGCEMNKAESAAVETLFLGRGWTSAPSGGDADLVLINTCSVRETAETRAKGRIAHYAARKREKGFTLVISGCMAERAGEGIKEAYPAVDYVVGTFSKASIGPIIDAMDSGGQAVIGEDASYVFSPSHLSPGAFRSYLPIMHGCDNYCSYCIVPYVRGRETSRPPSAILAELRSHAASGVREATFLGQNVNSYRCAEDGTETDFPGLLKAADAELGRLRGEGIGDLRWLRFLSSHPKDFSGRAVDAMAASPFLCRHLHLCVQHGSDRILAAMNRGYTRAYYIDLVSRIRSRMPGITLSTDLLTGFPGETEEDLGELLSLMRELRFEYAFMYYYNPRAGTKAASLPDQIPMEARKERLARVIALQAEITREEMLSRVGKECAVLVEGLSRKSREEVLARNQQDEMVVLPGSARDIGKFVGARLGPLSGNTFRAERMETCPGN
jgi:tRNA-2-methylthio-N6-dimethylallyladenosine synthase